MGGNKQELIVNLSGAQKKVLGFATWLQVSISAVGIILGCIVFAILNNILTALSMSGGMAIIVAGTAFIAVVVPFAVIAFKPIRDKQGDLLYYESTQLLINYRYSRREVSTYVNIQPHRHPVNADLPYVIERRID